MSVFMFFLGLIQCFILWALGQAGLGLCARAEKERRLAEYEPRSGWPRCALIIPASGTHPYMETALKSLLEQNYPDYTPIVVTASPDDAAMGIISRLLREYPALKHVVAGQTEGRGQKNHNLLAGVAEAGDADVYVFCDSTHKASQDFLRCLVGPIARHETAFATGYHEVDARDDHIATLGYALSVLFMRLMQGVALLTQPWGGALACARGAFESRHVAELWRTNVVDDCSLAAYLRKEGVTVRHCAAAILQTYAAAHSLAAWRAWLTRQILFLKFCMPGQWLGLGLLSILMAAPPIWCAIVAGRGILGIGGNMAPFLALCWFCLVAWVVGGWRRLTRRRAGPTRWLLAFFCACFMFCGVYLGTIWTRKLSWGNLVYNVGANGVVKSIQGRERF